VLQDAMRRIAAAARSAGKHWGMPCFSLEHGQQLLEMGARFLAHGADIVMIKQGLEQIQARFAPLGFTFDNAFNPGGRYYGER
jgi:4-hydroxy-2-oxoheptanedioate aldolase